MSDRRTTSISGRDLESQILDIVRALNSAIERIDRLESRTTWPLDLRPRQNPDGSFAVFRPSTNNSETITGPL